MPGPLQDITEASYFRAKRLPAEITQIKPTPDIEQVRGDPFIGLHNKQKYTCYMNSVLQCLVATPNFMKTMFSNTGNVNSKSTYKGSISKNLKLFLASYNQTHSAGVKDGTSKKLEKATSDF